MQYIDKKHDANFKTLITTMFNQYTIYFENILCLGWCVRSMIPLYTNFYFDVLYDPLLSRETNHRSLCSIILLYQSTTLE